MIHKFLARYQGAKDCTGMVPIPGKQTQVALIDQEKGALSSISTLIRQFEKLSRVFVKLFGAWVKYHYGTSYNRRCCYRSDIWRTNQEVDAHHPSLVGKAHQRWTTRLVRPTARWIGYGTTNAGDFPIQRSLSWRIHPFRNGRLNCERAPPCRRWSRAVPRASSATSPRSTERTNTRCTTTVDTKPCGSSGEQVSMDSIRCCSVCCLPVMSSWLLVFFALRGVSMDRVKDGKMLANYRLSAELTAIETTSDGRCIVVGTVDGCLSVLAIADPLSADSYPFLASLPSRSMQVKWSELRPLRI